MAPKVTTQERRARLVERHCLDQTATSVDQVVDSLLAMHSSDPISPFLGAWARMDEFSRHHLERALYEKRSLWRLHAMRRTLFVVGRADASMFDGAVGQAVATRERNRLLGWVANGISQQTARRRLKALEEAVLKELSDGRPRRTAELSQSVPGLDVYLTPGAGRGPGRTPLASRLLYVLAMELKIVRAEPAGTWRSSQYHWVATEHWFGAATDQCEPESAGNRLIERYLARFGPATLTDIAWWTGWGLRRVASALEAIEGQEVTLEDGSPAWVAADDMHFTSRPSSDVCLLPGLDATPMGWKQREWFVGGHEAALFDRNGNIGPTIWIGGRIVGGWGQETDGRIVTQLLEPVSERARRRVAARAKQLTSWLDGTVVTPRFPTPLQKQLSN